ncbi:MAG: gamma-glutamylcyclotransferase [Burkholderiales bacterium]|nr:gamma-glutamylcyclotransferase [Burkholderiales bacterium]
MSEPAPPSRSVDLGTLNRFALENNRLREGLEHSPLAPLLLSEAELERSLQAVLASPHHAGDLWLFAYGSLVWNPVLSYAERRLVTVHGYHRRFCLWSRINRGTPESPGLVLGLDRGGRCTGVAYRIPAREVEIELRLLWRREMLLGSYEPRWVLARSGRDTLRALAFVVDRTRSGYVGRLPDDEVVAILKRSRGRLGTGLDYLLRTADGLAEAGVRDPYVARLAAQALAA